MKSLLLSNGDLVISQGDLQLVEGNDEIKQCVEVSLGTNRAEWFLNPEIGLSFEHVLGKATDDQISAEISLAISQEPRINTIEVLEIARDNKRRKLEVYFEGTTVDGDTIEGEVNVNA